MNHFHCLVLLWGSLARAADPNTRLERKLRGWARLDRTSGNLATYPSTDPGAVVQEEMRQKIGRQHVGVAVRVRNFSPFVLSDPKSFVDYGWEVSKVIYVDQSKVEDPQSVGEWPLLPQLQKKLSSGPGDRRHLYLPQSWLENRTCKTQLNGKTLRG